MLISHLLTCLETVLCSLLACLLPGLFFLSILHTFREGITTLKRLHQVPCDRCVFFTGDYRLKCTVRPMEAMTEVAIGCKDFELAQPMVRSNFIAQQVSKPLFKSCKSACSCKSKPQLQG